MENAVAEGAVKSRYDKLATDRTPFLNRARTCATYTIPALMPPEGHNASSSLPTPYQGLGARGINNLSAKLLLTLFPPNSPFFRLAITDFELKQFTQDETKRADVEKAFNEIERAVADKIETTNIRVQSFEVLKQLLNSGNVLVYLPKRKKGDDNRAMKVFKLDRYVCKRDAFGEPIEIITKEDVSPETIPYEVREVCNCNEPAANKDSTISIYTHVKLVGNKYRIKQEINGVIVPDSISTVPKDKASYLALRFTALDNEDYGRSFVEEYIGDLITLEELTKAIVEGAAAAAKVIPMIRPGSATKARDITDAENGKPIVGNPEDVNMLQIDKFADFRIPFETINKVTERLSLAFMLRSSVQRDAERVTAEEIRLMAGELDDSLGGVYSILSQEYQLPLVNRLMFQMEQSQELPALPKGLVKPAITTGLEALGRGQDLNKLNALINQLSPLGQETVSMYLNVSDYIKRTGTALGMDMDGLVKTEDEVREQKQQLQMAAMAQAAVPQLAKGAAAPPTEPQN